MSTDKDADEPTASSMKANVIGQLLSNSDNWVKLATIALIVVSGSGNWFATKQTGDETKATSREEAERIRNEIHQIFTNQDVYIQNLKQIEESNKMLREIQAKLNQPNQSKPPQ